MTQRTEVLVDALRQAAAAAPSAEPLTESLLFEAVRRLGELHDPEWGGFGRARRSSRRPRRSSCCCGAARPSWRCRRSTAMAAGGMYDLVGGGFHRYSVDERWLVPHFEKMLYDNALLVPAYLHGWLVTGRERYREVVEETVEYLLRDLRLPGGGFASSQDADTDGVEGLTYTWAPGEGAPEELLEPFEDGRFVLRGSLDPETRARLLELRARRPAAGARRQGDRRPGTASRWRRSPRPGGGSSGPDWVDEARALGRVPARAAVGRARPARTAASARARRAAPASSTTTPTSRTGSTSCTSRRASCAGSRSRGGWRCSRSSCSRDDEHGGFFLAPAEGEQLVARRKELYDHPVPSGNSMLAYVLLRLARIYGDDELERRAVGVLRLFGDGLGRGPTEFAWALNALDLYLATPRELAIVGPPESEVARAALEPFEPNAVVAFGPAEGVPLLEGKDSSTASPRSTSASASPARRP